MQKFEDNVFSIIKTTNLSPSVFSFLQPTDESSDKTPLGGILEDTKYGWLALGPKFCVIDLRNGLKVAAYTFGSSMSNCRITISSVVELPTPLTENSKQLLISVECEDVAGLLCVLHINGSQILRCIHTDVVFSKLAVCDSLVDGPFSCFDGVVIAGTKNGEVLVFDLNRSALIQALKDISQGYENLVRNESNPATVTFLPFTAIEQIADQRELALENEDHISVLLNKHSLVDGQYIFRNPDGTVRMKAKRDHIRVSALEYFPQLGSVVVGFNFGAFQIWNLMTCELEFTSQVNVECLPVTHFGFQEPCDDPRAFCYLWVVFSVTDRCEEEEYPLAVMYSLTYHGKRMLSETSVLYQEFSTATIRFQIELGVLEEAEHLVGGRCISCLTYSISSTLGDEGEDSMLNLCQLVWECWGEGTATPAQYGMLLFDLDQWYKDQMPATWSQGSSAFMSRSCWWDSSAAGALHVRLQQHSLSPYSHATRLEEHFYPNSLQYNCICLNTSEAYTLKTVGRQRSILQSMDSLGPQVLLNPTVLYNNCVACGLAPLNLHPALHSTQEEQRSFLLSVALEARLARFLQRCARAWASGSHAAAGCTLSFLVEWAYNRAVELKQYAHELTLPLFARSLVPDSNTRRGLAHCAHHLTQLAALLDAVLTHCCSQTVPHGNLQHLTQLAALLDAVLTHCCSQTVPHGNLQHLTQLAALLDAVLTHCCSQTVPHGNLQHLTQLAALLDAVLTHCCSQTVPHGNLQHLTQLAALLDAVLTHCCSQTVPHGNLQHLTQLAALLDAVLTHCCSQTVPHGNLQHLTQLAALLDAVLTHCCSQTVPHGNLQHLTQLAALLDAVLTHCCSQNVPHALNDIEEKYKGVGLVSLYLQVVQWFLRVGLLPERGQHALSLPYPVLQLQHIYHNRRRKLRRLDNDESEEDDDKPCSLLYIDQLIENELGGERVYDLWKKAGSETGLYPPPSLYSLLRLYLLPDISEEHKHSLVLYLLVDYSMVYDEVRHEPIIRRLMQFPTMFGLSNTAIKATQAFWHLDHRDFDFALDQLQCLTGNTLSDWQHNVVLSSLLAQNKTQAALQYLHVRKPAPIQSTKENTKKGSEGKLEEWVVCCRLYLARGLVVEALHEARRARALVAPAHHQQVLHMFYDCCRKTGQLSKLLSITLTPQEEEVFIKYLENCNDPKTSDILVMYYLQQSRYLEAKQYNDKLKQSRSRVKELATSVESINSVIDKESTRDTLVDLLYSALPNITNSLATCVFKEADIQTHVTAPKPMSVFVEATTAKNTFTYKSSFIQDTIENASETWINKPKMRKGIKRALNIEEIPFICTPKLNKSRSLYSPTQVSSDVTPAKRAKIDLNATPRTPKTPSRVKLSKQMEELLNMPDVQSPEFKLYERSGAETPHSILKSRIRSDNLRESAPSPADSRYLPDSDEELDTASNHTHYSDYTNKHLRFTIPTASEGGSTPSPIPETTMENIRMDIAKERARLMESSEGEKEMDTAETRSYTHTESLRVDSPVRQEMSAHTPQQRKSYKDTVRARGQLSISTSSLSDDPNTSVESIADIPMTLINPKYYEERRRPSVKETENTEGKEIEKDSVIELDSHVERPITPKGRRSIKSAGEVTPPRNRSRSTTPERMSKSVMASPRLEAIKESPVTSSESPPTSPRRSLRSRSRTPDIQVDEPSPESSPRSLRSRSKTPEKLMSPKTDRPLRSKKSLSRIVLEANTFAKATEKVESEAAEKGKVDIECTPMKPDKPAVLMDVTLSPINKSVLNTTTESPMEEDNKVLHMKSLPAFTINETYFEKSVLHSYESSIEVTTNVEKETVTQEIKHGNLDPSNVELKALPAFTTINMTDFDKSVLGSYESSLADASDSQETKPLKLKDTIAFDQETKPLKLKDTTEFESSNKSVLKDMSSLMTSDSEMELKEDRDIQKEKERIVEIEREISEIEGDMSDDRDSEEHDDNEGSNDSNGDDSGESEEEESESDASAEDDAEVISINDTDSNESSSNDKLQIDENSSTSNKALQPTQAVDSQNIQKEAQNIAEVYIDEANKPDEIKERMDPLVASESTASGNIDKKDNENLLDTTSFKYTTNVEDTMADQKEKENNFSLMTDDNSVLESDKSDITLNYSDERKEMRVDAVEEEIESEVQQEVNINIVVETITPIEIQPVDEQRPSTSKSIDVVDAVIPNKKPAEAMETENTDEIPDTAQKEYPTKDEGKPKSKGRKRANSSTSNKSTAKESKIEVEPRTPLTRKRSKSITSNVSITENEILEVTKDRELKTPENVETKRRANTPTSAEVRKILTRRASKELSEIVEDPKEELMTPKRRSTRSRSRNDDNASVASESSVKSSASKSESADVKPAQVRKGRKSILLTKPDLSVIPENTVEDSKVDESEDVIGDYSSSRRLTRHQRSLLSSLVESKARSGRVSAASHGSVVSDTSMDDDNTSVHSSVDERLELLNRDDFNGTPDPDELARSISPESIASDASKQRRARLARAASETKTTPVKAAKINRRISVDIAGTPERASPSRRASFNRACEALHTPKGRRASTDLKKSETGSVGSSPGSDAGTPVTPARRTRKGSTASATSARSKKTAAEQSKDSKK